ncbi:hypothetical protein HK105_202142 [Polyrhizophydium stewartii]|uniref:Uncharacterized protein n=1 Tax=Polyrhizophydium stewartii TaxID=2732419 RepID=A0ABR4NFC8_9FUNG
MRELLAEAAEPGIPPSRQIHLLREAGNTFKKRTNVELVGDDLSAVLDVVRSLFRLPGGTERSVRSAMLALVQSACAAAGADARGSLDSCLASEWSAFLALAADARLADAELAAAAAGGSLAEVSVSQLTGLVIALLESPGLGQSLVASRVAETLAALARSLGRTRDAIHVAARAQYNPDDSVIVASHHLLQACIAVVSKLPAASTASDADVLDSIADLAVELANEAFLTYENRILAGLLIATLVSQRTPSETRTWIWRMIAASRGDEAALTVASSTDAVLVILNGFLHVVDPAVLVAASAESSAPLIVRLYATISATIKSSDEPRVHTLAFGTLARLFDALKSLAKKNALSPAAPACRDIIVMAFQTVLDRWEDPLIIIQNKLRDLFVSLIGLISPGKRISPEFAPELDRMIAQLLSMEWHKKAKYDLLAIVMHEAPARNAKIMSTDILEQSFLSLSNYILSTSVIHFINSAVSFLIKMQSMTWVAPLIRAMVVPDPTIRKMISEKILPKLAKSHPESMRMVVDALQSERLAHEPFILYAQVAAWKVVCGTGASASLLGADNRVRLALSRSISHPDTQLRFEAFELLVSGPRPSQELDSETLDSVKAFLQANLCVQSSDSRQRLLGQLQRLLERVKRALYANVRTLASLASKPNPDDATHALVEQTLLSQHQKQAFIAWLQDFATASLFPGASFQRATTGLAVLKLMSQVEQTPVDDSASVAMTKQVSDMLHPALSDDKARTLFARMAFDTYDATRIDIISSFTSSSEPLGNLDSDAFAAQLFTKAMDLLKSVRAADTERGVYLIIFLFHIYVIKHGRHLAIPGSVPTSTQMEPAVALVLDLCDTLERHLVMAEQNMALASEKHPLNGLTLTLGHILKHSDLGGQTSAAWKQAVNRTVDLCFRACQCTLPVCSDASPEGSIPAAFDGDDMAGGDAAGDIDFDRGGKTAADTSAQLILRHCFRTLKEASFVLDTIVGAIVLPQTVDDTIRHRGAFSAAHASFTSIARRLLIGSSQDLAKLPRQWLEEFLGQVTSVQVSVTRRSAGLPFAVLSLLSPAGPSQDLFLEITIPRLCEIASQPISSDRSQQIDAAQVHAFNILRVVIHDSELTQKVRKHLGTCFVLCIRQFSSPLFPLRNCAAMMFSSLIGKCFGVQKTKDGGDAINSSSSREFFSKFPNVYPVLLEEFTTAVAELEKDSVHPLLHPILTVLARIKPSPTADANDVFSMVPFVDLVRRCASARLWKVREMAARVVASLVDARELLGLVSRDAARIHELEHVLPVVMQAVRSWDVARLVSTGQALTASVAMEITSGVVFACHCAGIAIDGEAHRDGGLASVIAGSHRMLTGVRGPQQSFVGPAALVMVGVQPLDTFHLDTLRALVRSPTPEVQHNSLLAFEHLLLHRGLEPTREICVMLVNIISARSTHHTALAVAARIVVHLAASRRWTASGELWHHQQMFAAAFGRPAVHMVLQGLLGLMVVNVATAIGTDSRRATDMTISLVEAAETTTDPEKPHKIPLSLLSALDLVDWRRLFSTVDAAVAVRLLFFLDSCLCSEWTEMRTAAARHVSAIANKGVPLAPLPARWLLRREIVARCTTHEAWRRTLAFFAGPLMSRDVASAIAVQEATSVVLFDKENANALFEEFSECVFGGESLIYAAGITAGAASKMPGDLASSLRTQLAAFVSRGNEALQRREADGLFWDTSDPVVFAAAARLIVCATVANELASAAPRKNENIVVPEGLLRQVHPLLRWLSERGSGCDGWRMFRSIVLGE